MVISIFALEDNAMSDKYAESADLVKEPGARALFAVANDECVKSVANRVLNHYGRASPDIKRLFKNELDKLNLPIPGFRNASVALRSPNPQRLADPVRVAIRSSDGLATAALRIWAESRQDLRDSVSERLDDIGEYIGVNAEYPDFDTNKLRGIWSKETWERERDRFVELYADEDQDEIEMMMCYVAGRLPGPAELAEESSELSAFQEEFESFPDILKVLSICVVDLQDYPVSAAEWETKIPELADKIAEVVEEKREERSRAATLDSYIEGIRADFAEELAYLERDIASWSADSLATGEDVSRALSICEELRSALEEFHDFREALRENPLPATSSEEKERRSRNDELEEKSARMLDRAQSVMSGEPTLDDDPSNKSVRADERADDSAAEPPESSDGADSVSRSLQTFPEFDKEQLARENYCLQSQIDELNQRFESLQTLNGRLEGENETLRSENGTLANDVQFLKADKADMERDIQRLQSNLVAKENDAETWRLAYEEESRIPRMTVEDAPMRIKNVRDAVRYAEELFPDRLLVKLNSKSEVRNNPFENVNAVWGALQWLATTYRDSKSGVSRVTNFDQSVKEVCGWRYMSGQHETTINKNRDWYTTKVNGKTYWLLEHIGTGSSKDARHTIRIAFDWDKDEKTVVVGYIGQHQRTDAT